jgi:uncharacterized membrane protein
MPTQSLLAKLRTWFLQGLALLAPLVVTLALLIWLGRTVEDFAGALLRPLLPKGWYIPGMGLIVGFGVTLAAGLLANLFLVRWLVELVERLLNRVPLVKGLLDGLKDIARFFARTGDQELGHPVLVTLPAGDALIQLIGFVMQEHVELPVGNGDDKLGATDIVAVYLPMSYQIGGYTVYLRRDQIQPLAVGAEQALRSVITGGALEEASVPSVDERAHKITALGAKRTRKDA